MVVGIETFKAHFKDHMDKFIMIGGTACDIVMSDMGLDFRSTKDLDIVLIIEALDIGFSDCFWHSRSRLIPQIYLPRRGGKFAPGHGSEVE